MLSDTIDCLIAAFAIFLRAIAYLLGVT